MLDINILAAWGEFIGGIAVVVSLIYLGSQIRQNSRLLRTTGATAASQANFALLTTLLQDEGLSRIYWDGLRDRSGLPESDIRRFDMAIGLSVAGMQQMHSLAKDDLIDADVWDTQIRGLKWQVVQPGGKQWWSEYRGNSGEELRGFVDGLIREGEAAE